VRSGLTSSPARRHALSLPPSDLSLSPSLRFQEGGREIRGSKGSSGSAKDRGRFIGGRQGQRSLVDGREGSSGREGQRRARRGFVRLCEGRGGLVRVGEGRDFSFSPSVSLLSVFLPLSSVTCYLSLPPLSLYLSPLYLFYVSLSFSLSVAPSLLCRSLSVPISDQDKKGEIEERGEKAEERDQKREGEG